MIDGGSLLQTGGTVLAAVISFLGGRNRGKHEGRTEFIQAVEKAASLVINNLSGQLTDVKALHEECLAKHEECEVKYADLQQQIINLRNDTHG